jgi:vacuolar-type H+-ATPase subunit H
MEGSVKSLIEAEEEAHKIVQQAEKEKTEKVKDAHQMAAQILNAKEKEYKAKYEQEERNVS